MSLIGDTGTAAGDMEEHLNHLFLNLISNLNKLNLIVYRNKLYLSRKPSLPTEKDHDGVTIKYNVPYTDLE